MFDPVELACELINIESITPNDNGCQALISDKLNEIGANITHLPSNDVTNLWATIGKAGPLFVFSGHTDTVPPGPLRQWTTPPFTATVRNNTLYGRGAADMKSAIAAMLCAMQRFLRTHPKPHIQLGLMITSDEEGEAIDGTRQIVHHLKKQGIAIDWCLIGEATAENTLGDLIKIGRRGSLHGTLQLLGKQGHIAYPQLADNPIHRCFTALDELAQKTWDRGNEHFDPTSFQIYNIHADTGASNMIPGSLSAQFNFRFAPTSNVYDLQHAVEHTLNSHQLQHNIEWNLMSEPFLSRDGDLREMCQQAIAEHCHIQTQANTAGGTSDGRFIIQNDCEIVELGPINRSIHQVNEHIAIADLKKLTDIYYSILNKLNDKQSTKGQQP